MNSTDNHNELFIRTFHPFLAVAEKRIREQGARFIYYTTASTALKILRNREIWMRNTTTMNDFMEVKHGLNCLVAAYNSDIGRNLDAALDSCFAGMSAEIRDLFNAWMPGFRHDTFVTCVSEHDPREDQHGRLSMWRAYGGASGVALVINGGVMFSDSTALAAYTSPVAYLDSEGVAIELRTLTERIQENREFVQSLGIANAKNAIFHALRFSAVCTKHPAFCEEREWRVVASPSIETSALVPLEVEDIHGVPQHVLKIKLQDHPDHDLFGLEPKSLIDRVLIGPCENPNVIARAFRLTLEYLGVPDAMERVHITDIPLRIPQT